MRHSITSRSIVGFLDRPGRREAALRGHGLIIHQREHDLGHGDKADGERDNGDGD
jgi:hypothetical protein